MRSVPQTALDLAHTFEQGPNGGFAPTAYIDPVGVPTIGWGHALRPGDRLIGETIDAQQADDQLLIDMTAAAQGVCDALGPAVNFLTDDQYAAVVDFTFNEGVGHFLGSTMCHLIKAGQTETAAGEFMKWVYGSVNGIETRLPGLVRRRAAEQALYETQ